MFQDTWTNDYFFLLQNEKSVCLICSETTAALKEYNLKRHYSTKHSQYGNLIGHPREEKVENLRKSFDRTASIFSPRNRTRLIILCKLVTLFLRKLLNIQRTTVMENL